MPPFLTSFASSSSPSCPFALTSLEVPSLVLSLFAFAPSETLPAHAKAVTAVGAAVRQLLGPTKTRPHTARAVGAAGAAASTAHSVSPRSSRL